ncbi:MAG TPA: dipeptidase [Balneolaceae bacterium]
MNIIKKVSVIALLAAVFISCSKQDSHKQHAQELAQKFIIVDGHVDLPIRLKYNWEDVSKETGGDFDYLRAKEGGLNAPFMSIYISARYQKTGDAKAAADSLIDLVERIAAENPDKFAIATSPAEIKKQFKKGLISLPMGMENGAPIGNDLSNIQYFYDRGIRYITLTHSKDNLIGDSSYDTSKDTHNGLSEFGEKVVREMNRVGIMVDVSHITDETFYDVMEVTKAPVIASHSSCRHFTPGFERNMSDALIKKLAENGGVIMINFGSTFIDSTSIESSKKVEAEIERLIAEKGWDPNSEQAREFSESYFKEHFQYSTVEMVANHIDRVVDLVGINHVGLGSDFDGVGPTLPEGLKDVSDYPNLIAELLRRGYSGSDIKKICSGNVFRVWNEVIEVAENLPVANVSK